MPRFPAAARAAVVVAIALLASLTPVVRADDARIAAVRVGYDGLLPPERWAPLWVTIQPGDHPQTLALTAAYEQDPTQQAVMSTPVTTTPGRSITVPLLVCPPQGVARIKIDLTGGRRTSSVVFARAPRDDEQNLSQPVEAGALVIGTLGQRVPEVVAAQWNVKPAGYANTGLDHAVVVPLRPADVGETWAMLDGLNVLVTRLSVLDALPTASLDAVSRWITGGGRLVLVADAPGSTWRRFTPPGVALADQRPVRPSAGDALPLADGTPQADSFTARTIRLDETSTARGWTASHRAAPDGDLIAAGPYGGGLTVIVGFDPALASASLSDEAVLPFWSKLLTAALPDRDPKKAAEERKKYPNYYMTASGDGPIGSLALGVTVDRLCDVPPVPGAVYVFIVLLSTLLAIAVSIVDFFVLGRFRSRHRSWMTAAAWITAFGAAAWVLPNIARRQDTTLGRVTVIDALPAGDGPPAAWRTAVTAVFSSVSDTAAFTYSSEAAMKKNDRPLDGYWRGVSVLGVYSFGARETQPFTADLPLLQRVSALDGAAAAVVPPSRGIPLKQWTLRTLQDAGPAHHVPTVQLVRQGEELRVTVRGVPHAGTLHSAALHTSNGWAELKAAGTATPGLLQLSAGQPQKHLERWSRKPPADSEDAPPLSHRYDYGEKPAQPQDYLLLDGPRRRTPAFDALAAAPGYAVVHLLLEGPPDLTTDIPHRAKGLTLYRIAVPITFPTTPRVPPADNP